jgi:hypothetical protein
VACGRREVGEPRSVEGSGVHVGRSVGVTQHSCAGLLTVVACGRRRGEGGRLRRAPRARGEEASTGTRWLEKNLKA